jgi:hypothetical protein
MTDGQKQTIFRPGLGRSWDHGVHWLAMIDGAAENQWIQSEYKEQTDV